MPLRETTLRGRASVHHQDLAVTKSEAARREKNRGALSNRLRVRAARGCSSISFLYIGQ